MRMPASHRLEVRVTASQAGAFRLARQGLASGAAALPLVDVVRASGGIQAQVMSAAEMSIWTRRRATSRADIQKALWETRDLVRTSAMRLTLHVIPADDLPVYISAIKDTAAATLARWHARVGATPRHVVALIDTVVASLDDGEPMTQQELIARAKKKAGAGVRAWLDHAWSAVSPAVIEGLIVYGPPRGSAATFVRTDKWLGRQKPVDGETARVELLRRFLAAFGPATPHDFAKWSGLKTSEARRLVGAAGDVLAGVSVDGAPGWILREDVAALERSRLDPGAVRLLGAFDSLLLAHATKEQLVAPRFYKRVYRPQGWISPVVLRGGTIVGVWFSETIGRRATIRVELFGSGSAALRRAIDEEAEAIGAFLGTPCQVRFRARG